MVVDGGYNVGSPQGGYTIILGASMVNNAALKGSNNNLDKHQVFFLAGSMCNNETVQEFSNCVMNFFFNCFLLLCVLGNVFSQLIYKSVL